MSQVRPGYCADLNKFRIVDRSGQRGETYNIYWRFTVHLTLMMTSAQAVYTHPDDLYLPTYEYT